MRFWDAHLIDARQGERRYEPQLTIVLFSSGSDDINMCNAPDPVGRIPAGQSWRISGVGLGLHFSETDLYREAFRSLSFTIWAMNRPLYMLRAQQFLDAAITSGMDPDPGLGFAWSQMFERPLVLPHRSPYSVHLHVGERLQDRLVGAAGGMDEGREEYRRWFSEIRIYLLGRLTRDVPESEL